MLDADFLPALRSPDPRTRARALAAAAKAGPLPAPALEVAAALLQDRARCVRAAAAQALPRLGMPGPPPALQEVDAAGIFLQFLPNVCTNLLTLCSASVSKTVR